MFSSTESQGKTAFSWKMKIRLGSGPRMGSPSTEISPWVAVRKPPAMLSRVDLPHPEGPTRQTNSPSRTSRLMSSRTWTGCACPPLPWPFPGKLIQRPRTAILVWAAPGAATRETAGSITVDSISTPQLARDSSTTAEAPADFVQLLHLADQQVEPEPDQPDHHHAGDH